MLDRFAHAVEALRAQLQQLQLQDDPCSTERPSRIEVSRRQRRYDRRFCKVMALPVFVMDGFCVCGRACCEKQ
jgi:hypothetical protein